ncbi:MAG: hypothetical protein V4555_05315 [Acidobacteriota bacterium]
MTEPLDTKALLRSFLDKPLSRSTEDIEHRIIHWMTVVNNNNPSECVDKRDRYAIAAKKKTALQNLTRLITKHPTIAAKVRGDLESQRQEQQQREAK